MSSIPPLSDLDALAVELARIVLSAGPAIMEVYASQTAAREKTDGSPVTLADERAEAIILARLRALDPSTPVVAEEAVAAGGVIATGGRFYLVDPLDGTREFIARNGEFTVNIGLIVDRTPVAGAVYAPARDRLWFAGRSAFACDVAVGAPLPEPSHWRRLATRSAPAALVALASRSHADPQTEAFLAGLPIGERISAGSSLKFCALAEGRADVYPRFAPTMEWDTAAADAVLRAAGGAILKPDGGPFLYAKNESGLRNSSFIAWGDPTAASRLNVNPV